MSTICFVENMQKKFLVHINAYFIDNGIFEDYGIFKNVLLKKFMKLFF